MWGLGLELLSLGLSLGFYDKVLVSVLSRSLSQVSVSEVKISTTSLDSGPGSGSERKTQNPARIDFGIQSHLC